MRAGDKELFSEAKSGTRFGQHRRAGLSHRGSGLTWERKA